MASAEGPRKEECGRGDGLVCFGSMSGMAAAVPHARGLSARGCVRSGTLAYFKLPRGRMGPLILMMVSLLPQRRTSFGIHGSAPVMFGPWTGRARRT